MTSSEIYDALKSWIEIHGFDNGYRIQKRRWSDGDPQDRFIVIQSNNGGVTEEALIRDSFRFLFVSGCSDPDVASVEDLASKVRQTMIEDYSIASIFSMQPFGGIPNYSTAEKRIIFEMNFNALIAN
ncbi:MULTISPECIES: hypothetical protein [Enterobacterales]|uniref:phage tail termination protein n=1 Tax=Enterobacterales TaxID=91347 RepID=UPI002ED8D7BF